jgi:CNT family concentrative nucleoside transporter
MGYAALLILARLLSENRRAMPWRSLAGGIALQWGLCVVFFEVEGARQLIAAANALLLGLQSATRSATAAVFGYLGGATPPFELSGAGSAFILAFQALPIVLVISALTAVLFHWGVLPLIVRAFAWALSRAMGVRESVGLSTAANIFLGMVEARLLVRPYLGGMSRSELFALMSVGMAGVAGTVMALYAGILTERVLDALGHVLVASLVSAPAALVFAFLMVPPTEPSTQGQRGPTELLEPGLRDASTFGG